MSFPYASLDPFVPALSALSLGFQLISAAVIAQLCVAARLNTSRSLSHVIPPGVPYCLMLCNVLFFVLLVFADVVRLSQLQPSTWGRVLITMLGVTAFCLLWYFGAKKKADRNPLFVNAMLSTFFSAVFLSFEPTALNLALVIAACALHIRLWPAGRQLDTLGLAV